MSKAAGFAKQVHPATALLEELDHKDSTRFNSFHELGASDATGLHAPVRLSGVPGRLDESVLPDGTSSVTPNERPDIIFLTEAKAAALLTRRFGRAAAAILPVVDATGRGFGTADVHRADMAIDRASRPMVDEAIHLLRPAVWRLRALPLDVFEAVDPRLLLLARLFVRGRSLAPRSDVRARQTFSYDDESAIPGAAILAEQLTALGLMEREFVDKVTVCPHCASARMTVREHCARCGGANIVDEPIVHHLKCAYQGPERDFRRGNELACPKCRQQLKHFSVDYDRPGSIGVCLSCGHLSSEHKVGFLCLDCDSRVGARDVSSKTIHSYRLTPAGCACVENGSPIPLEEDVSVGGRIRAFARRHSALGEPCSILFIRLHRPEGIRNSGYAWRQICVFFGHTLRECFTSETEIIEESPIFLALLSRDRKTEVEQHLPKIRERLTRHLALEPKLELAVFAPDEVPGIAERPIRAV